MIGNSSSSPTTSATTTAANTTTPACPADCMEKTVPAIQIQTAYFSGDSFAGLVIGRVASIRVCHFSVD